MTLRQSRVSRRTAAAALALALPLAVERSARAQASVGMRRVGLLALFPDAEPYSRWLAAFRDGFRQLGHVEGRSLVIESRYAAGQAQRMEGLAADIIASKVDVLVTAPAGAAAFAVKVTRTVPIVFIGEPDPVGTGLVASLSQPGGNMTGLADAHADLVPKRLDLLRQLGPPAARIAMLWNPSNPSTAPQVRIAQSAATSLGIRLVPVGIKGDRLEDMDQAFDTIVTERTGGVLVVGDATLGTHRQRIAELAIRHRLPTSGSHGAWSEGGLLMSYGTDFTALFRRGAAIVDRILKGTRPADLPVEQPTAFEFVLNMRTAKAIGLTIPRSVLSRADRLIE
jgi:putative ABC transport system substrate-binding protein